MTGQWEVQHTWAGGEKIIQVCRMRDINKPKHSGNLEYVGEAQRMADKLNGKAED